MKKILITGAAGMLGSKIADYIFNTNTYEVFGTGRKVINTTYKYFQADLLNANERNKLLQSIQPDVIVHCAANVNLNDCEIHSQNAYNIHVNVSEKLAEFNVGKTNFIYISTDSVFNGNKGNYSEADAPEPLNVYAKTKLQGEYAVTKANSNSTILRTNIYGFNSITNGNSLFEWIYKNLHSGNPIIGFTDIFFNPLYTGQVADIILSCIKKNITGIFHAGSKEQVSKYTFAKKIAETFSFDMSLIKAGNSDETLSAIKRPKNTTLNSAALYNTIDRKYNLQDGINQLKFDFLQYKKLYEQY